VTGKSQITHSASKRLQILVAVQIFWLALVCLLGAWWGRLVLRQAGRIEDLQVAAGFAPTAARAEWARTQRMLFWESSTYYLLVLVITGFLFWLYYRDLRRARGIQAFFASVTHELRTPLTSIRLQAESIADNLAEDATQAPLLERLLEDTTRLEAQVERTLELARVEGGGSVFLQAVQLRPWVARQQPSWIGAYGKRVEFVPEIDPELMIDADPTALQVIFKNLIENSIRHAGRERVRAMITTESAAEIARVYFRDDGSGFAGDATRLGELFHRGKQSQGSGVGLYLVDALMAKMGGHAAFASRPGEGFIVELAFRSPRKEAANA
jgi:signal transduction histidine kinase